MHKNNCRQCTGLIVAEQSYPPTLVAETTYYPEKGERQNAAFQRLAGFIFGDNSSPNRSDGYSEKIAMTSPVTLSPTEESWTMRFMMPSQYTESTLPKPNDPGVRIFTDSGGMYAAVRYSGRWTDRNHQEKLNELESWIRTQNLRPTGEPIIARYDPPWTPWFMRRNEVLLAVQAGP